jgi:hypothetical protein
VGHYPTPPHGLPVDGVLPHATQRGGLAGWRAGGLAGWRIGAAWRAGGLGRVAESPPVGAGDRAGQKRRGRTNFFAKCYNYLQHYLQHTIWP